jgi:hypothetical protein
VDGICSARTAIVIILGFEFFAPCDFSQIRLAMAGHFATVPAGNYFVNCS